MSTATPQETLETLRATLRRWGAVWCAAGVVLILLGIGLAVSPAFAFGTARTDGTVTRVEPEVEVIAQPDVTGTGMPPPVETHVVYYPVVEYQVDGRTYVYRPRKVFSYYPAGHKLPVIYRVDRPRVARLDTFSDRWMFPVGLGVMSVFLGSVIVAGLLVNKHLLRKLDAAVAAAKA
jgi:hypothetical protein